MSVGLTSSNAAVTVPATVVVPANATSAGFTATVTSVTTAQSVTLTASAGGVSKTFALQLNAAVPTLTHQSGEFGIWQRDGEHANDAAGDAELQWDSAGDHQLGDVDGNGFHDVGSHLPSHLESDPVGDAECAI